MTEREGTEAAAALEELLSAQGAHQHQVWYLIPSNPSGALHMQREQCVPKLCWQQLAEGELRHHHKTSSSYLISFAGHCKEHDLESVLAGRRLCSAHQLPHIISVC